MRRQRADRDRVLFIVVEDLALDVLIVIAPEPSVDEMSQVPAPHQISDHR
jgi:hypothetical protein